MCVGQGHLCPARHLMAVGCAHPPMGSVSPRGSDFFRGEVGCGAKWGLLCWVRGTWRLQHFPCWGLGADVLSSPSQGWTGSKLGSPKEKLPKFLPFLLWVAEVTVSKLWLNVEVMEATCLATACLSLLILHVGFWMSWP